MYDRASRPALELADRIADLPRSADLRSVLQDARRRLDSFAQALAAARVPPASVAPAQLALGLVIDKAARENEDLRLRDWAAGAHRLLFDGEEMSVARLRDFADRALIAGPAFRDVALFLEACLRHLETRRAREEEGDGWRGLLAGAILAYAALVVAWAVHAEWAFHRDTLKAFEAEAILIGLDRSGDVPDLPARMDRLAAAVRNAEQTLGKAPVRLFAGPLGFDASQTVEAVEIDAAQRHLPNVLARAIDQVLASEGDSVALYETLRAWDVLRGAADWNPAYLQGWLAARANLLPDLQELVPHLGLLRGASPNVPPPDPEILAQARDFAAQAPEPERAWIELLRSPAMTAVPSWRPDLEIAGLDEVAVRHSRLPISTPIPGAYTTEGWAVARDGAIEDAIATARAEARRMFGRRLAEVPESEELVLERLQRETLTRWRSLLDDLRVRPFTRRGVGVQVSGLLARQESPLDALLRATWVEVGGTDRTRPPDLQLRIAAEFGPMIQYVEGGGLRDISALFASLNAALGARSEDEAILTERLMGFQERAASVAALQQAPPVVVRIVEDVLAQVGVAHEQQIANPFTQAWQAQVFDLCRRTTEGRFPFDAAGVDADPTEVAALLGPGGALEQFFRTQAQPWLDTTSSPWRWKTEARFEGLSPDSAVFFERAQVLRQAFFGPTGQLGSEIALAALAERGKAVITLGGIAAAVDASSETATLAWPGPDPSTGVSVVFQGSDSAPAISRPGPWGLLRLLSELRLRERDEGRRFLVDLRGENGRLFVEMTFPSGANPVAALRLAEGFGCPAAL